MRDLEHLAFRAVVMLGCEGKGTLRLEGSAIHEAFARKYIQAWALGSTSSTALAEALAGINVLDPDHRNVLVSILDDCEHDAAVLEAHLAAEADEDREEGLPPVSLRSTKI